jgi:NADPH:quinone reductase-like Zn-dependent oxidoreductase
MRAVLQDEYGENPGQVLRLKEIDRPEVGPEDVLVRVHAASVHIGDWHLMTGLPYLLRVVGFGFRAPNPGPRDGPGRHRRGGQGQRHALIRG